MSKVRVILPDGSVWEAEKNVTPLQILERWKPTEVERFLLAEVNGQPWDLFRPVADEEIHIRFLTFDDPPARDAYRHTTAHVLAQAVKELFPNAKLAIGPPIENGFYYDFDIGRPFTEEDLQKIEQRMKEIVAADYRLKRLELPKKEAEALLRQAGETYKLEILAELDEETVSFYQQDGFIDLCRGPHIPSTGRIGALKLLNSAGAYWRGDERNPMLQRIYGTCFPTAEALQEHLTKLEEAQRRDHRRLGRELGLFIIEETIGSGLVLWLPKGGFIRNLLEEMWRAEHLKRGYQIVYTPHIARTELWDRSGHTQLYSDFMFPMMELESQKYLLKPMNCPLHITIFKTETRSYRDLPIRLCELGTVYRYERSGALHGLTRVRGMTCDDAHIFCRMDQAEEEFAAVVQLALRWLRLFGFDEFTVKIATRPTDKFAGTLEIWDQAESIIRSVVDNLNLDYELDVGGGAFYGPKLDIFLSDCLGRKWQCSTIQLDPNLPLRLEVNYVGQDNRDHPVVMIHRALFGTMERFMAILTEHYAGAFPTWMAPVQAIILPIADRHLSYAQSLQNGLKELGARVEINSKREPLSGRIFDAEAAKIPIILVVGDREVRDGGASVRLRGKKDLGYMPLTVLQQWIQEQIKTPKLDP